MHESSCYIVVSFQFQGKNGIYTLKSRNSRFVTEPLKIGEPQPKVKVIKKFSTSFFFKFTFDTMILILFSCFLLYFAHEEIYVFLCVKYSPGVNHIYYTNKVGSYNKRNFFLKGHRLLSQTTKITLYLYLMKGVN